jgi:hypothetical protein|uniref:DUF4190 domain-containing protein n=1 Tax=Siphoviridae sp. ctrgt10 TaxID=2826479 RepID=A0A8S5M7A6_9CAUD|nr:MAG TPA: protein of unknown function (DUF4190) [Siphoviridae sp. ctrgt10]
MNKELNVLGLISMVIAIVGLFVFGIPCGVASLILGIIGIATAGDTKGKGMAVTGTVLGAFDLLTVLFLLNIVSAY